MNRTPLYPFDGARVKLRTATGLDAEARDRLARALVIMNAPAPSARHPRHGEATA